MTDENRACSAGKQELLIAWITKESDVPGSRILDGSHSLDGLLGIANDLPTDLSRQLSK